MTREETPEAQSVGNSNTLLRWPPRDDQNIAIVEYFYFTYTPTT